MANILNHAEMKRKLAAPLAVIRKTSNLTCSESVTVIQWFTFAHGDKQMPVELHLTVSPSPLWVSYQIEVELKSILSGSIAGGKLESFLKSSHHVNSIGEILTIAENIAACAKTERVKAYAFRKAQKEAEAKPLYDLSEKTPEELFNALPEEVRKGSDDWKAATAILRCIISDILAADLYVRVIGEEGAEFKRPAGSDEVAKIHENVMAQDVETIEILRANSCDYQTLGFIVLVHSNGWESITDNTDTPLINGLLKRAESLTDLFSEEATA